MSILTKGQKEIQKAKNRGAKQAAFSSFVWSQWILLQSRKKWGMIYALATVAGFFCIAGVTSAEALQTNLPMFVSKMLLLPLASFTIIVGM